tara:strand:+ start:234 stop:479 length:246 start_codon:yes stop_codon:yes gene_type:complete
MSQATDDMIAKYAAETQAAFLNRVQDDSKASLVAECIKREYANASNVDRACWDGNPFEAQNDAYNDSKDLHTADQSGKLFI